mmetsp:Transcript_29150/g.42807  ORF Transcript_29150/g.42807 Transcript_29150/m.42807 type:complete len:185 (+) Transcript_29150:148-702(+)
MRHKESYGTTSGATHTHARNFRKGKTSTWTVLLVVAQYTALLILCVVMAVGSGTPKGTHSKLARRPEQDVEAGSGRLFAHDTYSHDIDRVDNAVNVVARGVMPRDVQTIFQAGWTPHSRHPLPSSTQDVEVHGVQSHHEAHLSSSDTSSTDTPLHGIKRKSSKSRTSNSKKIQQIKKLKFLGRK